MSNEPIQNAELTQIANELLAITERRDMTKDLVCTELERLAQRAGDVSVRPDEEEGKRDLILAMRAIAEDVKKSTLPWIVE